ncbi:MAG: hypothetical protein ACK5JT_07650 [Hyphomicrobiaceae bacterium]
MLDRTVNYIIVHATIVIPALIVLALMVSVTARKSLRAATRVLARILLIVAVVALVYDGTRTMAGGSTLVITSLEQHWVNLAPKSYTATKTAISTRISPVVWTMFVERLIRLPAWLLIGSLGLLLSWVSRRRREISVFINT